MPAVDESIGLIGASKVFSKLDSNSEFWQICFDETMLTTFLTPFGRFAFNRLPFGISSARKIFARMVGKLLGDIEDVICHMDNIHIHGKDFDSHYKTLRLVLSRLEQAGLMLNKAKRELRRTKVKFLGHIIDEKGVSPDPVKVTFIQNFPAPTCKTELRRLNNMLNQLAKFVPHLSQLTAPMRKLLKKSNSWMWDKPQEESSHRVKQVLASAQIIAHYDPKLHTVIATDTSNTGLGATMFQIQRDGTQRPVYYTSRSLTPVFEKETLAIAWALIYNLN